MTKGSIIPSSRNPIREFLGLKAWLEYVALQAHWWLEQWAAHPETMPTTTPKAQVRLASAPRELKEFYSLDDGEKI